MNQKYPFRTVEEKWRPHWDDIGLYKTGDDPDRPRHYILDYFPYPSGAGLSVGHCRNYVPTCIATRYLRMNGYNVLHPMGWDSFGLPAENHAIEHGTHPAVTSRRNAARYRHQLQLIECAYDWSREIDSTDPEYYRWTQWFFLLLYRRGLAYRAAGDQWWCPQCQTILANEQVETGGCWRCQTPVAKKTLRQWYFKITDYAERLLADLDEVAWPEGIKAMQRNWIGRSEGADVHFQIAPQPEESGPASAITTFTTRPDTVYGVTFLALAPEHPLLPGLAAPAEQANVSAYIERAARRSEIERQAATTAAGASGAFTGRYAVHPLTGARIPIWVAAYVLPGYGSGAIMGVPAHDERDYAFAQRHRLPVVPVIRPPAGAEETGSCFTGAGEMINSGPYDGLPSTVAAGRIAADLAAAGRGEPAVSYKLRDWLISRQRYWGAPIPIVHCPTCGVVPVPETALPVLLPEMDDYAPAGDGRSPLARAQEWVQTECPACGGPAERETDTMDGFACSSWYFLRFASPHETEQAFDPAAVAAWLPVDTYVGGAEHAVMHLLYARFWTKVLHDAGLVDFSEPFQTLRNQGVLHAANGQRMSKSKGNVVTPDEVIARYGTDALRAYIVFLGPFEANVTWDERGIKGITRFLDRLWTLAEAITAKETTAKEADGPMVREFRRRQHETIRQVTGDMEAFKFNTAVAALMGWLNYLGDAWQAEAIDSARWRNALATFAQLLAPIAPFIAEEIWQALLGREGSVHRQPWPTYEEAALQAETITLAVQVNGRVRDTIAVAADEDEEAIRQAALASDNVRRHLGEDPVRRVVHVPGRLVNIVV